MCNIRSIMNFSFVAILISLVLPRLDLLARYQLRQRTAPQMWLGSVQYECRALRAGAAVAPKVCGGWADRSAECTRRAGRSAAARHQVRWLDNSARLQPARQVCQGEEQVHTSAWPCRRGLLRLHRQGMRPGSCHQNR